MDTLSEPHWTARSTAIVLPARRRDVIVDELDDEVVFGDPEGGGTFHLNATARLVWDACDGRTTAQQIARTLTDRFDVDFDAALDDVEQVLVRLAESDLLMTRGAA